MQLRPYQREAVEAVYAYLRSHDDNPVVVIPTAGGKTPIMATICRDAVTRWDGRVLILAHVKELLEQAADKLRQVCPDVRFGVYSAGLKRRDTIASVIVAGIQSVWKKAQEFDPFDLVMVDECHLIGTDEDGMYRQFLAEAKAINPHLRVVGLTATPYRLKSGLICSPDHFLNAICYEVGVRELIVQGYLCPLVTKAGKARADTSGLHVRGGEYVAGEVEDLMDQDALVRAACAEIVEQTRDRQAVLIFASGIKHGEHVVRVLKEQHGIECGFVSGETSDGERDRLIARFRHQEWARQFQIDFGANAAEPLKYLCNVNVLTTGFDAPNVDCVVLLRPTLSPGLYYQMCLDMETEVLTPSGWRRCHEVAVGDTVAAFDTDTEEIVYVPALDKVHRRLGRHETMYGITAPHLDVRVTDQHTMVVKGKARTCLYWQTQTAAEAAQRQENYMIPVAGKGGAHQVDADISDAEVAFIGWFLTDGYLNRLNNIVTISQSPHKYASIVRDLLTACDFGFREYSIVRTGRQTAYADGLHFVIPRDHRRGTSDQLRGWAALEPWLDKDIPRIFDTLSQRQFGILLDAMNQGNGANQKPHGYVNKVMAISVGCRQRIADRIQQLAIERGYRCNVTRVVQKPSDWNPNPQPQWMIRVKPQRIAYVGGVTNFTKGRKPRCRLQPVVFAPNEWVWCLTTEKETLVTRRNGKVAILGNCGRGFRLHPGKENCLVLDYGGNVLRHGPVDGIKVKERTPGGNGQAPAKECPECHSVIAAGYARCPDCGYEFPPAERGKHDAKASEASILSGQVTITKYVVRDVYYGVHKKRGAPEDAPRTMRVDYKVGWHEYKSEWVCFEHTGYARAKAVAWWKQRSHEPVPETAEEAVALAQAGRLATTREITVRSIAGEDFDRIIGYELGDVPPPLDDQVAPADALDFPFGYNAVAAEEEIPW